MAAPVSTQQAAGNRLASTSVAASGTTSFTLDYSSIFEGQLQIGATFGTIAATAGLRIQVGRRIGSTPVNDTQYFLDFTLAAVAGAKATSIALGTGRYNVVLTNLDATNGLTSVYATDDTVNSVS